MNNVEIKEAFDFLYLNEARLTSAQMEFIESLKKYFTRNKQLSEKQQNALVEIKKYMNPSDRIRISMSI